MILIVDNTQRKSKYDKRESILDRGIPCALCDMENMSSLFPAGAIIITEKYLLSDARYMSALYSGAPVMLCEDENELPATAAAAYSEYCRDICEGMYCDDISFDEKSGFSFCAKELYTTATETRILKVLMMGGYYTAEQIRLYCFKGACERAENVSVHICNINKKALLATGKKIIVSHRFSGYRMCDV